MFPGKIPLSLLHKDLYIDFDIKSPRRVWYTSYLTKVFFVLTMGKVGETTTAASRHSP